MTFQSKVSAVYICLLTATSFVWGSACSADSADIDAARKLAAQIVESYGGLSGIGQSSAGFRGTGKLVRSGRDAVVQWQDDRIRFDLNYRGKRVVLGRDGGKGWIQLGSSAFASNDPLPSDALRLIQSLPPVLQALAEPAAQLRLEASENIGSETFDVISVWPNRFSAVVDRRTHLIRRLRAGPGNITEYGGYHRLNNTMVPFEYAYSDGGKPALKFHALELMSPQNAMPAPPNIAAGHCTPVQLPLMYRDGKALVQIKANGADAYFGLSNEPFTQVDPAAFPGLSTLALGIGSAAVELNNAIPEAVPDSYMIPNFKTAGILGQDVLRNFTVEINYPKRRITFRPPSDVIDNSAGTVNAPLSIVDTDLVVGVTASQPMPLSIDIGSPVSALPRSIEATVGTASSRTAAIPMPVLTDTFNFLDRKQVVGYSRIDQLQYGTIGLKKPVFAVSRVANTTVQDPGRNFGILGAKNLRNLELKFDYVNNRIEINESAEIGSREFFLSLLDDLQQRHFAKPLAERVKLYKELADAAAANGQSNIEVLARMLSQCSGEDTPALNKSYAEMDLEVQQSRDRVAFGLLKALWVTHGCGKKEARHRIFQLEMAERRAPEQPYVLTKLAEAYYAHGDIAPANNYVQKALRVDSSYQDALAVWRRISEPKQPN